MDQKFFVIKVQDLLRITCNFSLVLPGITWSADLHGPVFHGVTTRLCYYLTMMLINKDEVDRWFIVTVLMIIYSRDNGHQCCDLHDVQPQS